MRELRHALPELGLILSVLVLGGCRTTDSYLQSGGNEIETKVYKADKPLAVLAAYEMSRIYLSEGRYREAERILIRIRGEYPGFLPGLCDLARVYFRDGRIDAAMRVLKQGLELSPRNPVLLNNLGLCRLGKGDLDEAIGEFTKACELEPRNDRYAANLALALAMAGRFEESLEMYEQFLTKEDAEHNLAVIRETKPGWREFASDRR